MVLNLERSASPTYINVLSVDRLDVVNLGAANRTFRPMSVKSAGLALRVSSRCINNA